MRRILVLFGLICSLQMNAQTHLPVSFNSSTPGLSFKSIHDSTPVNKWSLTRYSGVSTSFIFSKHGSTTVLSMPVGLQLNRRLNNNLYAFAGLSMAPAYINLNPSFFSENTGKDWRNNGFANASKLSLFPRAEMGLRYINDAKTFSISGSIGIERSNYPLYFPGQLTGAHSPVIVPQR